MKKILIIDDHIERWKTKVNAYTELIDLTSKPKDYFEYDEAGNDCKPKFEPDTYEYVFIHHVTLP